MFLGDNTSPDDPGYVSVISDVLNRFHPELHPTLISAGSPRQTAAGLRSGALLELLRSSKPDWIVVNVALADALREPQLGALRVRYRAHLASIEDIGEGEDALGPEHRVRPAFLGPHSDSGTVPPTEWAGFARFQSDIRAGLDALTDAGVNCALMTSVVVTNDLQYPLNLVLRAYNRAVREVAGGSRKGVPVIDVERAYRNVLERATNYKQSVALADESGVANAQGQALIARTFLSTFGLLPDPGFRTRR